MSTTKTELKEKIARYVRASTKSGLWGTPQSRERGLPIAFDEDQPTSWLPPGEVETRIAAVEPKDLRTRMQIRLGLADYRARASRDRQREIDRLYDLTPAQARSAPYASPKPARALTDQLALDIAEVLLSAGSPLEAPAFDSTRLLYSRSIVLPPGNVGEVEEVHRRIIRANVDGLDHIVIHQTEHWNSTVTASARGLGGVSVRPVRVRDDTHNDIVGERLDVQISFPPLNIGDPPRELQWTRRRQLQPGWLSESRSIVFASAPDHPTELMVIEVQFGEGATPATVARFDDIYHGNRLDPDIPITVVHPVGGAVRCEWQHPRVGLASGIRVWW